MNARIRKWHRWAAALLLMTGAGSLSLGAHPSLADTCIAPVGVSADTTNINAALSGQGAAAVLCPGATYTLNGAVTFTAPDQQIYTEGLPTDSTRATLVNATTTTASESDDQVKLASIAIEGTNESGITVENIQINGNRVSLGQVVRSGGSLGEALIEIGGNATGQTVQDVNAYETRGWSTLHIFQGTVVPATNEVPSCQGAQILNNTISDAGTSAQTNLNPVPVTWADGISLACGTSLVEDNTVTDTTDGGIVIFGAPGSTIEGNTITAVSRNAFGGIDMGDYVQVNGNYTRTTVTGNVIDGASAYIETGIGMGTQVGGCAIPATDTDYGGTVTGNTVEGENIGYGYPVSGVSDWTVTGNTDTARHVGVIATGTTTCDGGTVSQPGAFQAGSVTSSTLQSQYVTGLDLTHPAVSVTDPSILRPQAPTSCGRLNANQGLYPRQAVAACFTPPATTPAYTLNMQGDGNLVLRNLAGTALWASGTSGKASADVIMQADGNLVIYDTGGNPLWGSGTAKNPNGAWLAVQPDGKLIVYFTNSTTGQTTVLKVLYSPT